MYDCTASMVIYNNPQEMVRNTAISFLDCDAKVKLTIIDNSPTPALQSAFRDLPVNYHFYGENVGYGRGHNWAIQSVRSKYHLILNPDIIVHSNTIKSLITFMDSNPNIGIVCSKVLNEDGTIQPLNKRYPTIYDLLIRRFLPEKLYHMFNFNNRLAWYETRDMGYESIHDVEFMSGCFMFCRTNVLKLVGGFDERYFMYFEDCDLGRKIQLVGYRTVYFPYSTVTHLWERASHKSIKMACVLIANMIKYFNKWGWRWF